MTEFDMEPGLSFAMKDVIGDTHEKWIHSALSSIDSVLNAYSDTCTVVM
jgi:hypothetical protein